MKTMCLGMRPVTFLVVLLLGSAAGAQADVARGPYLQSMTAGGVVVRWRTDSPTDSRVRYGDQPGNLVSIVDNATVTVEHEVAVTSLAPATRYYYSVGSTAEELVGNDGDHYFDTSPAVPSADPVRLWVIGDSGTAHQQQLAGGEIRDAQGVRDSFLRYTGSGDALVTAGSTWRYLDDGSDQGTAWRASGFDDSTWNQGLAQLGYGDGDEQTVVSCGPSAPACTSANHITTYFRQSFAVTDASLFPGLTLSLLRDDGAVAYLNGTEVMRTNLPPDPIDFMTLATGTIGGADETRFHRVAVDASLLVDGTNVLAVEIHQRSAGSSDVSLQAELFAHSRAGAPAGLWLMAGDNAYDIGTDEEWQQAVFDPFAPVLRNTVLWPVLGNHDIGSENGAAYAHAMTLPTAGEAGGVASGTEEYYAFDHGGIHVIALDSTHSGNRQPGSAMLTWLAADLAANTSDWTIAIWHHPPYSKGSHDSDDPIDDLPLVEMRENVLPILEASGVDVVFTGHSHSYERSLLIDGFYTTPTQIGDGTVIDSSGGDWMDDGYYHKSILGPVANEGTVYSVVGSSGKTGGNGTLDHPVMFYSAQELGSMVLDVDGNRLDGAFIDRGCAAMHDPACELDRFTLVKGVPKDGYINVFSTRAAVSAGASLPVVIELENITGIAQDYSFALALVPPGMSPVTLFVLPLTLPANTRVAPAPSLPIPGGLAAGNWELIGVLARPGGEVDRGVLKFSIE